MAISPEYSAHVRDLFAELGPVEVRRMFGGAGIYLGEACFALIVDEAIYMRTDPELAEAYAAAGSEQWIYGGHEGRGPVAMPYWRLPETAADDPGEAADWARRSLVPAERAAADKRTAKVRKAARATAKKR